MATLDASVKSCAAETTAAVGAAALADTVRCFCDVLSVLLLLLLCLLT